MWSFTLRAFTPTDPDHIYDLHPIRQSSFGAEDISSAKRRLTEWIANQILPVDTFYRLGGSAGDARLVIAFYLFADRRLCPVRIWDRTELFGQAAPGARWMVDFNGIPAWSVISGVEPQWERTGNGTEASGIAGRSARDWRKRACWTVKLAGIQEIAS